MRPLLILALLLAGCASIPAVPAAEPPSPEPVTLLVRTESRGGLCMTGTTCASSITVMSDGTWTGLDNGAERAGTLPDDRIAELADAVQATRLADAPPFTGTCPIAYDGQEHVLTWIADGRRITIGSCEREFDPADPLVVAAVRLARSLG